MSSVGLHKLLTSSVLRLPSFCLAIAISSKLAYLLCVVALLDVTHGFQLALVSAAGHLSALVVVGVVGAWIARTACQAERVLLLEEVLVIRSLKLGDGDHTGSDPCEIVPKIAAASSRIMLILKRFHFRVAAQRASEFQQWCEAPERRWLSGLVNILILISTAFLVGKAHWARRPDGVPMCR